MEPQRTIWNAAFVFELIKNETFVIAYAAAEVLPLLDKNDGRQLREEVYSVFMHTMDSVNPLDF